MEIITADENNKKRIFDILKTSSLILSGKEGAFNDMNYIYNVIDSINLNDLSLKESICVFLKRLQFTFKKIEDGKTTLKREIQKDKIYKKKIKYLGGWTNSKNIYVLSNKNKFNSMFVLSNIKDYKNYELDRIISHELIHQFVDPNLKMLNNCDALKLFNETFVDMLSLTVTLKLNKYDELNFLDADKIFKQDISKYKRFDIINERVGYLSLANITRLLISSCELIPNNNYEKNLRKGLNIFNMKYVGDGDFPSNPFIYGLTNDFEFFFKYFEKYTSEDDLSEFLNIVGDIYLNKKNKNYDLKGSELKAKKIIDKFFVNRMNYYKENKIMSLKDIEDLKKNYKNVSDIFDKNYKLDEEKLNHHEKAIFRFNNFLKFADNNQVFSTYVISLFLASSLIIVSPSLNKYAYNNSYKIYYDLEDNTYKCLCHNLSDEEKKNISIKYDGISFTDEIDDNKILVKK